MALQGLAVSIQRH